MIRNLVGCLAVLSLLACGGKSSPGDPADPPRASFGFAAISSPAAKQFGVAPGSDLHAAPASAAAVGTTFDFGGLTSSATYFFELRNTGTVPLSDAKITTDAPDYTMVTPGNIGVLPVSGQGTVIPLVSVQVLHGVGANGYGTVPTLTPGPRTITLTATAKDPSGNTITTNAAVQVDVKVADFEITAGDVDAQGNVYPDEILKIGFSPSGRASSKVTVNRADLPYLPATGWWIAEYLKEIPAPNTERRDTQKQFHVKNLGNVPLTIKTVYGDGVSGIPAPGEEFTVAPGATVDIPAHLLVQDTLRSYWHPSYAVVTSGAVVFATRLPAAEPDGRYYLALYYTEYGNY